MVLVKWVLSAIVGCAVGFILLLINSSICMLVSSAIAAVLVAAVVYYSLLSQHSIGKLAAVVIFIVVCILYLCLLIHIDENGKSIFWGMIPFMAPYVIATYAFFAIKAMEETENSDNGHTEQ